MQSQIRAWKVVWKGKNETKWQPLIAFPLPPPSLPSPLADPSLEGGLARQKRVSGKPEPKSLTSTVGRGGPKSCYFPQIQRGEAPNSLKSTAGRGGGPNRANHAPIHSIVGDRANWNSLKSMDQSCEVDAKSLISTVRRGTQIDANCGGGTQIVRIRR